MYIFVVNVHFLLDAVNIYQEQYFFDFPRPKIRYATLFGYICVEGPRFSVVSGVGKLSFSRGEKVFF